MYPSDLQLELEYWTETGEYDEDELHEVRIKGASSRLVHLEFAIRNPS